MPPLEDARPAARRLLDAGANGTLQLAARPDADGILAVALLAKTLARLGRPFHARFVSPVAALEPEEEAYAGRVLLGLPAPAAGAFGPLVLIDPDGAAGRDAPDRIIVRPGPADGRALAPLAFALACAMDERAVEAAPLALAGASAAGTRPWAGWTAQIVADALRRGDVREESGLGFDDTPLLDLLAVPPDPLRGILDGYEAAGAFLHQHGLPADASVHELEERSRRVFASGLAVAHLRVKRAPADLARLFSPCAVAKAPLDTCVARLAGWFEAAAAEGETGLALGYALGDVAARQELEAVQTRHRAKVRTFLRAAGSHPPATEAGFTIIPVDDGAYLGLIARLVVERVAPERPALAHAGTGGALDVALRRPSTPAYADFHAGNVLAAAARRRGGAAYGGARAAVAHVSAANATELIADLAEAVAPQAQGGAA